MSRIATAPWFLLLLAASGAAIDFNRTTAPYNSTRPNAGGIYESRVSEAARHGITIKKVESSSCKDESRNHGIKPFMMIEGVYFQEDQSQDCYQVLQDDKPSVLVGVCLPNGPKNTGPKDETENYECLGRCGPGCGDTTTPGMLQHWVTGCLAHDFCTYFTKATGGASDHSCGLAFRLAERGWLGLDGGTVSRSKSSYSTVCSGPGVTYNPAFRTDAQQENKKASRTEVGDELNDDSDPDGAFTNPEEGDELNADLDPMEPLAENPTDMKTAPTDSVVIV